MPGRPTPAQVRTENAQYYKILGVSKDACKVELRRAWRREAKKCHPDKGGDNEKFNELCEAYNVLSDPHERRKYDQHQEEALPGRSEVCYMAIDYRLKRRQRLKLGKDVMHPLVVSDEELQTGTTKLVRLSRNIICSKCKGKGSKSGASVTVSCTGCQGTGKVFSRVQHRGRNWRISYSCKECRGTGETISIIDRCPQCKGDKVVQERKILEIHVEKGMKYGQEIRCPEEANEAPGIITGDVVLVLRKLNPRKPMPLDSEDDSEEDSEEMLSVSEEDLEEDGEESSSDHEVEGEFSSDSEEGSEEHLSYSEEEDSEQDFEEQTSYSSEEDHEEDSDIEFFLRQIFKEDGEEDSDIEFVLRQIFKEDHEEDSDVEFSLSELFEE